MGKVSSVNCGVSQNRILVPYALAKVFLFAFCFSALRPSGPHSIPSLAVSLSLTVTEEASNLCRYRSRREKWAACFKRL